MRIDEMQSMNLALFHCNRNAKRRLSNERRNIIASPGRNRIRKKLAIRPPKVAPIASSTYTYPMGTAFSAFSSFLYISQPSTKSVPPINVTGNTNKKLEIIIGVVPIISPDAIFNISGTKRARIRVIGKKRERRISPEVKKRSFLFILLPRKGPMTRLPIPPQRSQPARVTPSESSLP